jgi:pimeloyl-ACP methyl ester carboxylesterase
MRLTKLELADGTDARIQVVGQGDDVVVLHGLSGSWRWWSPLAGLLERHHRLHLVELPKLGRIRAGALAQWLGHVLDATGLGPVHVLAHSLGGLLAAELAAQHPERVRRLALVAPAGIPCERGVLARSLPLLEELYHVRTRLPTIVADAARTGPVSLVHGVAYVWERDLRSELGAVRAPTLLVWGRHDRLVPVRVALEWQRLLPDSRLVQLPCGHVPMWEAPRELAASLREFFGDQVTNDLGHEIGSGEMRRMRLVRDSDEAAAR